MSYNICYKTSYGKLQLDRACFSSVFSEIDYNKNSKIDVYVFKANENSGGYYYTNNQLAFTDEEVGLFYSKVSKIFDAPTIRMATKEEASSVCKNSLGCDVYVFSFDFTGKTNIYIKSILTYTRYLFEDRNGFGAIVRNALLFSEKLPEIPFIEIFAVCHASKDYFYANSNHSLVYFSHNYQNPSILTEAEIIKQMNNADAVSVHKAFGLYYEPQNPCRSDVIRYKVTEELIINFKRKGC